MSWDTRPPTVRRAAISFSIERLTAVGNALRSEPYGAVRVRARLYAVMYIHVHVHIGTRARHRGRARTRVRRVQRCRLKGNLRARGLPRVKRAGGGGGDTNGSLNSTYNKVHTRADRSCAIHLGDYLAISTELRRNRPMHALRVRDVAIALKCSSVNNNVVLLATRRCYTVCTFVKKSVG